MPSPKPDEKTKGVEQAAERLIFSLREKIPPTREDLSIGKPTPNVHSTAKHGSIQKFPVFSRKLPDWRNRRHTTEAIGRGLPNQTSHPGCEAASRSRFRGDQFQRRFLATSSSCPFHFVAHGLTNQQAARHVVPHHAIADVHFRGDILGGPIEKDVHDEPLAAVRWKLHQARGDPGKLLLGKQIPLRRGSLIQLTEEQPLGISRALTQRPVADT